MKGKVLAFSKQLQDLLKLVNLKKVDSDIFPVLAFNEFRDEIAKVIDVIDLILLVQ